MKNLVVCLIRHGKTKANDNHLYCGKSDISLSENGISELNKLKSKILYEEYEYYFTSGAKRANETMELLYPNQEYKKNKGFREYDFGEFEMKSYDMLKENKDYISWITNEDGQVSCPNGESKLQYRKRIKDEFNNLIEECFINDINSLCLVCHGGTIGTILEIFYDNSKSFYEHQPSCGRGYKLSLEIERDKKFKIINIENI